jgi:flagellar basal-body rod modification protein FlgD
MAVNSVSGSSALDALLTNTTSQPTQQKDALGEDAFLKMLVAQMQHQDPLNPMQGTDFTSQLAQFSSLEQSMNMNTSLQSILTALQQTKTNENVLDYIGKDVTCQADRITLAGGSASGGYFTLPSAAQVNATIKDADNNVVANLYLGALQPGTYPVTWNGTSNSGTVLPDGQYRFTLQAAGADGVVPATSTISGTITGVAQNAGKSYLLIGDQQIDPASVIMVTSPSPSASSAISDAGSGP